VFAVKFPTDAEALESRAALFPANAGGMQEFAESVMTKTESEIAPQVVEPTQQDGPRPIDLRRAAGPGGSKGAGFAEVTAVSLFGCVVVGVHDDGSGAIRHSVTLCPAPARILVVFGVLHFRKESALGPDGFAQAAADHAEKVFPP